MRSTGGMWPRPQPSRLSMLASHNSRSNGDTNIPTRDERRSVAEDSSIAHFPKPNSQGDSGPRPSTTQIDDEREGLCQHLQLIDR